MAVLDPEALFQQIAGDLPDELRAHVFVVGSLAAAYQFRRQLQGRGVNTKDADLVVHPAGDTVSCAELAERLLALGWRPTRECKPAATPADPESLRAIRLRPPSSDDYFVELLNLPATGQTAPKLWVPVQVQGGWYGLPTFRFQGLTGHDRRTSDVGLEYASAAMMALANLLAHPIVGDVRMPAPAGGRSILRGAKDLGRVLALATLAGRDETEERWRDEWRDSLQASFPADWREHAGRAGSGLRELLGNPVVLEEARHSCDVGLLAGMGRTAENLKGVGERLLVDVIEQLEAEARG